MAEIQTYWVLVRLEDKPGAAVTRAYVNAYNPFAAIALARSMYGNLLISESANPA